MNEKYPPELNEYAKIHGHICFGLAMGYQAAMCAKKEFEKFPFDKSELHEEVTVLLQSSECTMEGIQLITPCTCETGHLIHGKSGKYVFIFFHRKLNKALRLSAKTKIMAAYQPISELKSKIRQKAASKEEIELFWKITRREVDHILEMPNEQLFNLERFEMALLVNLSPFGSLYVSKKDQIMTIPNNWSSVKTG